MTVEVADPEGPEGPTAYPARPSPDCTVSSNSAIVACRAVASVAIKLTAPRLSNAPSEVDVFLRPRGFRKPLPKSKYFCCLIMMQAKDRDRRTTFRQCHRPDGWHTLLATCWSCWACCCEAGKGTRVSTHQAGKGTRVSTQQAGTGTRVSTQQAGKGTRVSTQQVGKGTRVSTQQVGRGTRVSTQQA